MTIKLTLGSAFLFLAIGMMLVSGCDRTPIEDPHFGVVDRVEVLHRGTGTVLAVFQRGQADDQFQIMALSPLTVGEEIAMDVEFTDVEGNTAHLGEGEEFELGVRLARADFDGIDGQEGIVSFEAHGDHVDIEGEAPGETHIVFQLMHGTHSDFDTPPLRIEVVE